MLLHSLDASCQYDFIFFFVLPIIELTKITFYKQLLNGVNMFVIPPSTTVLLNLP